MNALKLTISPVSVSTFDLYFLHPDSGGNGFQRKIWLIHEDSVPLRHQTTTIIGTYA